MPLPDLSAFLDRIEAFGGREAIVWRRRFRTERWSYSRLATASANAASLLLAAGIQPGERVLVRAPNSPHWVAAFLGGLRIGAVLVPVDPSADAAFVQAIARRAGCRAAFLFAADTVDPAVRRLDLDALAGDPPPGSAPPSRRTESAERLEIVFTSGSTGEPRGVIITHGNILAYLQPIYRGYERRRHWVAPLLPVRVLSLPPLGHLFGQAVGLFAPLMLGCTVVFTEALDAVALGRTLRDERIWAAMVVPRMLEMLSAEVRRAAQEAGVEIEALLAAAPTRGLVARAWAARRIQQRFGWRFRAVIVGGAPLDPELERLWHGLGYIVVQGYGLTETAPIVTLTHPFRPRPGKVGRPLGGQQVRLAEDGEILVRGANVMTGYWDDPVATASALDAEGWLHTGDLGALEPDGALRIIGRKKSMIVTAEGLNVHPEDVERALRAQPGVRDAVVIGKPGPRGEEVWGVLLLAAGADAEGAIAETNRSLAPHQRVRGFTVWPDGDFPRTPTLKPRRRDIAAALAAAPEPAASAKGPRPADRLAQLLARAGADPSRLRDDARLEDLGLSSLDLVDLGATVEAEFDLPVADASLGGTTSVADLRRMIAGEASMHAPLAEVPIPRWGIAAPVRLFGALVREGLVHPTLSLFAPLMVLGADHLARLEPPVLFVANHVSLLDGPLLTRALPWRFRLRLAPAIRAGHFHAWFRPRPGELGLRISRGLQFVLGAAIFQAFPLPQGEGFRRALEHAGALADRGLCPLVFPEGTRGDGDRLLPFQAGTGLMALRLGLPVVPLLHDGLEKVLPRDANFPTRAATRVRIGPPVALAGITEPEAAARRIEAAMQALGRTT
jgi:long-chain acyl-CoA synthetase